MKKTSQAGERAQEAVSEHIARPVLRSTDIASKVTTKEGIEPKLQRAADYIRRRRMEEQVSKPWQPEPIGSAVHGQADVSKVPGLGWVEKKLNEKMSSDRARFEAEYGPSLYDKEWEAPVDGGDVDGPASTRPEGTTVRDAPSLPQISPEQAEQMRQEAIRKSLTRGN